MTDVELAENFAELRIIPDQTNISGDTAIRYAYDAAMDMAKYKNEQIIQIFNFVNPYLPEHIREETLGIIKRFKNESD